MAPLVVAKTEGFENSGFVLIDRNFLVIPDTAPGPVHQFQVVFQGEGEQRFILFFLEGFGEWQQCRR